MSKILENPSALDSVKTGNELIDLAFRHSKPDRVAVISGKRYITFSKLRRDIDHVVTVFRDLGIASGHILAVEASRSYQWYLLFIVCIEQGITYIPVDIKLPLERKKSIIEEGKCGWHGVVRENGEILIETVSKAEVHYVCEEQTSYIIFTSGSTGRPKGAMIHHKGMLNHLIAKIESFRINEADVVSLTAPISFDISIWQSLIGLVCGITTVIFNELMIKSPRHFLTEMDKHTVSIVEVVPSYLDLLMKSSKNNNLAKLKYLMVTGEPLGHSLVCKWFDRFPDVPLINAYGPTEASDDITHCVLTLPRMDKKVPIGFPIRGVNLFLDDIPYEKCSVGKVGQLSVSGIAVGNGYINNANQTASVFQVIENSKYYFTGDIVEILEDKSISFISRMDNQVKVSGNRVELGEIENLMCQCEGVIAAMAYQNNFGILCCVYAGECEVAFIKKELKSILPYYMIPKKYTQLESLILNANGKIDRKAIRDSLS